MQQGIYMERSTQQFILDNCSAQPGELQVFYLFGKEYILGDEHYYVIRAAIEAENEAYRRGRVQFNYRLRSHLEGLRCLYFPGKWLIGWAVNQPGYGIYNTQKYWAQHDVYFGDCPVFMLLDGRTQEKGMYFWDSQQMQGQRDYYLFDDPQSKIAQDEVDFYEERNIWIS